MKEVSFNKIYESYKPLIESTARLMTNKYSLPSSEYDDLVQEAAIALFTSATAYDENKGITFGLYAKICIKNRLVSYISSRFGKTLVFSDVSLDEIEDVESVELNPEQFVIDKESLADLRAEIDKLLTPLESSVFSLYLVGTPYVDIAKALSKPTKSVDNAIRRIKTKILKIYNFDS